MQYYYNFLVSFSHWNENKNQEFLIKLLNNIYLQEEIILINESYFYDFILQITVQD